MTVTEIALLHLSPDVTIDDLNLRSKLARARGVMQKHTGRTFYYLQQVEDPTYIYIIGEWESLDQHINAFIPSTDNQELLADLKNLLTVDWLLHIDAPHSTLPLPGHGAARQTTPVYAIVRHFIKDGERARFQRTFEAEKHHLQDFLTEGTLGGGWRVDKEDNAEEWVLLSPWTGVEQHHAFAGTVGFDEYGRIREHIHGAEMKHARVVDV